MLAAMFRPFVDNDPSRSRMGMFVLGNSLENGGSVGPNAAPFTLRELLLENPRYRHAWDALTDAKSGLHHVSSMKLKELEDEFKKAQEFATVEILRHPRIVFSTFTELFKLKRPDLRGAFLDRIKTVIVDEAGTVPEPAIPMPQGSSE